MLLSQVTFLATVGVIFFWLVVLTVLLIRLTVHYHKLTKGVSKKDLKTVLEKLLKDFKDESVKVDKIIKEVEEIKKDGTFHIQKIGLVRYNPFAETGGNQSFCLSILDKQDSGLVISSLHSRDTTRVYAKPVKGGKSAGYELSNEEKMAIKKAAKIKA